MYVVSFFIYTPISKNACFCVALYKCTLLSKLAQVELLKIRKFISTLASFDITVQSYEGCGMLLWHTYIFLI